MRLLIFTCLILFQATFVTAQIDSVGSGHAMVFDGVDDYVNLGNIYDDLVMPFSISAWVNLDAGAGACPIFVTQGQDNSPSYKGFWFFVSPANLWLELGDGTGGNNPAFRRGKTAAIPNLTNRWIHVCGVFTSPLNVELYVNGINVNGFSSGSSNLPMDSNFPNEVARIGQHVSNGVTYRFKGKMDELRIFNYSLTQTQIQQDMTRKLIGNDAGLIGCWTFDETSGNTLQDKSSNQFDGIVNGNPLRIYSGAPLGDKNAVYYTDNWSSALLSMTEGNEKIEISNITGTPNGIHIYEIDNLPSQTQNLDLASVSKPYFGVFAASLDNDNSFETNYYVDGDSACDSYSRQDNSIAQWNKENSSALDNITRIELIGGSDLNDFTLDLGPNQEFCEGSSFLISPSIDPTGKSFLWNTGQHSSSISVTQSGKYTITVSTHCTTRTDSIYITSKSLPPAFTLGSDEVTCEVNEKIFAPISNPLGLDFTWQDGSHQTVFTAQIEGVYWLKVENECGVQTDTIKLEQVHPEEMFFPNVITPNGDKENQHFKLDEKLQEPYLAIYDCWGVKVFEANNYKNDWDGDNLAAGVYFYRMSGKCLDEKKGILNILR
jgi:hypothetical protein